MTIKTEALLSKLENRVESHIKTAVEVFQNLDDATLNLPASNGGWSIAQCVEHLNTYGRFYLPEIRTAIEKNTHLAPQSSYKGGWLGTYFANIMEPQSKKKMKAMKNHIPAQTLDGHAVVAEFIEQQETMLRYLHRARAMYIGGVRLPISISRMVRLKLGDVFQFCIAHDARHLAQAMRNLSK